MNETKWNTKRLVVSERSVREQMQLSTDIFYVKTTNIYFYGYKKTEKCQIWDLQRKPHNNYNSNNTFEDKITKCNNVGPLHLSPECCGH